MLVKTTDTNTTQKKLDRLKAAVTYDLLMLVINLKVLAEKKLMVLGASFGGNRHYEEFMVDIY